MVDLHSYEQSVKQTKAALAQVEAQKVEIGRLKVQIDE